MSGGAPTLNQRPIPDRRGPCHKTLPESAWLILLVLLLFCAYTARMHNYTLNLHAVTNIHNRLPAKCQEKFFPFNAKRHLPHLVPHIIKDARFNHVRAPAVNSFTPNGLIFFCYWTATDIVLLRFSPCLRVSDTPPPGGVPAGIARFT